MMTKQNKQAIEEFEHMRNMAELKALLKYAEMQPLTDSQYKQTMELKEKLFEVIRK